MQVKTILNRCQKFNCFVYGEVKMVDQRVKLTLEVEVLPRSNSKPVCNSCGQPEHKKMVADGYEPTLKHSRWCVLKREENLTEKQEIKLIELSRLDPMKKVAKSMPLAQASNSELVQG